MKLESVLAYAQGLLAIPSTDDRPEELRRALEFVLDLLGSDFTVEWFESGGKPSVLVYAGTDGTGGTGGDRPRFRVLLNAHLDVVPAPAEQFRPRLEGERLYCRGAQDMKVSALVQALVFRDLARELAYPIGLQLVTDEEVRGRDGTRHQLACGVNAEFVVIGEYSELQVVTESKGLLVAYLDAEGHCAHSAYQWLGDNALIKLMRSLDRLLADYPVPAAEVWRTTVNLACIETTNNAFNQIPADARAWLDIRFPAEDARLNVGTVDEVTEFLATYCVPGVRVNVTTFDPPHRADPDRPEVRLLQRAARGEGYRGGLLRKHGAADSRFFSQHGIDAVIFGIGGNGQHGPSEYADITTILPYYRALVTFLTTLDGWQAP